MSIATLKYFKFILFKYFGTQAPIILFLPHPPGPLLPGEKGVT